MSPRLTGYRERLYANLYDSVRLLDTPGWMQIFGNANVGDAMRCNLQVAGQLAGDRTFVIANLYVRTNVCRTPVSQAAGEVIRDAFLDGHDNLAIATLLREFQLERAAITRAFDEWAHACVLDLIIGQRLAFSMNVYDLLGGPAFGPAEKAPPHDEAIGEAATPWRRQLGRVIIVPVRQNFAVRLNRAPSAALVDALRAVQIDPEPLLWVHLEGLETRDVA